MHTRLHLVAQLEVVTDQHYHVTNEVEHAERGAEEESERRSRLLLFIACSAASTSIGLKSSTFAHTP